jgi:hypothetical protein
MIRQRKDRDGLQVQVYAGRDPLTGRKRYVSRQIPGTGRAAMKHAKQIEAQLLAEVGAGRHQRSAMTLAQLLDEWLTWRESNGKPISPATLHGYRLTVETKIKPALGYLPVAKIDARGAVAARYRGPGVGHGGLGAGGKRLGHRAVLRLSWLLLVASVALSTLLQVAVAPATLVGSLTAGATPVWLLGSFAVLSLLYRAEVSADPVATVAEPSAEPAPASAAVAPTGAPSPPTGAEVC